MDAYYSEVLPEDKAAFIEREKESGRTVIMIGDGINDSPALSAADVGIAIRDGAEIARELADVMIGADSLYEIVTLKTASNELMKRIHKNYRTIVGFNSGLILLGIGGLIQPTTSALLHNVSTLTISLKNMEKLSKRINQEEITRKGNPRKPQGEEGEQMLRRMNESHAAVTQWALEFLDFGDQDQVLDIGCGGGATLKRIAKRITSGHLTGVDYSAVSVNLSREMNAEEIQNGKMEILEASVEALPFEDKSFDQIVTVESFYFWPDPAENLKEVFRTLKEGGVFLLIADIYQKDNLERETLETIKEYQLFNPKKEEFRKLFEQAGFTAVEIHTKEGEDWICVKGERR